ncbi:hypothetical protein CUMW_262620 [Citrus unshiu]|uniref:Uncharacterized protein n=1 Tax=Citrus unshiu TaxID=55188 RepID=A0A2H5QUE2_CITUN|nr:hypothetical protein CUMW_262620 [Citrus unshiu]
MCGSPQCLIQRIRHCLHEDREHFEGREAERIRTSDIGDLNQNLRSHDNKIHWKSVKILEIGPRLVNWYAGNGGKMPLGNNVINQW